MAEITIVYKELEEAEAKAREIARACDEYEDELHSKVCNQIGSVASSPMPTGNARLSSANMYVKNKKSQLSEKSRNYKEFAKNCENLSRNAQNADKRVAVEVNNSRESFLKEHPDLEGSAWDAFIANIIAEAPILGWLVDKVGDIRDKKRDIKNIIRKWYEIDGGKKIIDTTLAFVGLVVAGVTFVGAIIGLLTASGVIATVLAAVSLVGAAIGFLNAGINFDTQRKANTCKDPAFAQYYGNIDDAPTYLRKKTYRGDERHKNNASMKWATGIEITEFVCDMVSFAKDAYDVFKSSGVRDLCGNKIKGKNINGNDGDMFEFDWNKTKKTFFTPEGRKNARKTFSSNLGKVLLGDDGFNGNMKVFKEADQIGKVKTLAGLDKKAKAVGKAFKIGKTVIDTGERWFKYYIYNEYDINAEIDAAWKITGAKGAIGLMNDLGGPFTETMKLKDFVS